MKGDTSMDQIEIGKFIAKCRKEKKLTQAQLAEQLNITDRAVSKWETGKSMPDSSIMLELCSILGITVNELLSGENVNVEDFEKKAEENLIELTKKNESNLTKNIVVFIIFSAILFIGSMVCVICDLAISGSLKWSLIPVSSIIFTWLVFVPAILLKGKRIAKSLLSFSIFIVPYLYILSKLIKVKAVFSIGTVMAIVSMAYLWVVLFIFQRLGETRKLVSMGIAFLLLIPLEVIINFILSRMIAEPVFDIWDILSIFIILIIALTCLACGYTKKKILKK